jgi:hypothetical protein
MPISRDDFNKGQDDTRYQILRFLKAHPEEVFEPKEIADVVYGWETPSDIGAGLVQLVGIVFGLEWLSMIWYDKGQWTRGRLRQEPIIAFV